MKKTIPLSVDIHIIPSSTLDGSMYLRGANVLQIIPVKEFDMKLKYLWNKNNKIIICVYDENMKLYERATCVVYIEQIKRKWKLILMYLLLFLGYRRMVSGMKLVK